LKDDSNDLYLAATDTRMNMLASTGLPADFVARRMRASRARSIALFLDCCYGGAFERGMLARAGADVPVLDSFGQNQLAEGAGRVVITASSAVEYAFESGDLTDAGQAVPSVFTSAIVEGISTGEADSDGTGTITVRELFAYAERRVRRENPQQTPHLWSFGTRGDIVVARTPLRRIVPAALPVAVQTALAGDRISRLGAVHVLSEILDEAEPSDALAAVQALQYLVDDDSKSLSEAAVATLRRVQLTAEPSEITVEAGTPKSVQVVLGGSVLAVAARVESSPDWIRSKQVGDLLTLTINSPTAAEGTVVITGPTGSVTLHVVVTATLKPTQTPAPAPAPEPQREPEPVQAPPEKPQPKRVPTKADQPSGKSSGKMPTTEPSGQTPARAVAGPISVGAPAERLAPLASPFGETKPKPEWMSRLWLAACLCEIVVMLVALNVLGGDGAGVAILLASIVLSGLFAVFTWNGRTAGLLVLCVIGTGVFVFLAVIFLAVAVDSGSHAGARVLVAVVANLAALLAVAALVQTMRVHASDR
jgi:outer membrane biosynthesis protein TonB